MNAKTLSDDRTFNVGGQIEEGILHARPAAVGEDGMPEQKSRRHCGVSAIKNRNAKNNTAQSAQSCKPNYVLEEGYVPEQSNMVTSFS